MTQLTCFKAYDVRGRIPGGLNEDMAYQAKGTIGRDIQKYGPRQGCAYIDSQKININAGVYTISGYSAHAGQSDLLKFVKRMWFKPQEIRLIHGDNAAK